MGSRQRKMPETKVPMTLRDAFLEDPFFRSGSSESKMVTEQREDRRSGRMPWLMPRKWMIPQLWDEDIFSGSRDSHLLGLQEDDTKMEISLDTTGYKPDELKVQVKDGELSVEGKHEEKSEAGHVMVSRQFSKRHGLPQGAKREAVMSNLSQDGVMVITVPKEKKIEELKAAENIPVEHVKNVGEMNKKMEDKVEERRKSREEEQRSEMADLTSQRSSRATNSSRGSSQAREGERSLFRDELLVPMTLRDPFMEDPFFKNTLSTIESSRDDFFKKAREGFEDSLKQMESMMSGLSSDWTNPSPVDSHFNSAMNHGDNCVIRHHEDETKMEVQLDTVGYKPDELKVEVEGGVVRVEGRHQEKSSSGQVMVSRQFARQYALPQGAKPEEVVSSLSKDGVLAIQVPKHAPQKLSSSRAVPIALK